MEEAQCSKLSAAFHRQVHCLMRDLPSVCRGATQTYSTKHSGLVCCLTWARSCGFAVKYSVRVAGSNAPVASSSDHGDVVAVGSGQPLKAFQVALKTMKEGEKALLHIKPECMLLAQASTSQPQNMQVQLNFGGNATDMQLMSTCSLSRWLQWGRTACRHAT